MEEGKRMTNNPEQTYKISFFLHKESVSEFDDCIKKTTLKNLDKYKVKKEIGLPGLIYVHQPTVNMPDWKTTLEKLTNETINISKNISNKAVVIFKYKERFLSIAYGYGKSILNESTLERNFGLIVAANLVDPKKIRSLNSMTIEDTIVDTQKQSIDYTNQEQFQINQNREILKSVSGAPHSETTAKFLVGTDSLSATRKMNIEDIKKDLMFYFDTYQKEDYKDRGFGWLDNIKRVKDVTMKETLDLELEKDIVKKDTNTLIGPNKILDWENIVGFYLTGLGKEVKKSISIDIDYERYLTTLYSNPTLKVLAKLKRDKLIAVTDNENEFVVSNIYDALVYEKEIHETRYLLCYGDWYEVDSDFYNEVKQKIRNTKISDLTFQPCFFGLEEGKYNELVANSSPDYVLLDQKNYILKGFGGSKVEPCDIFTRNKQLIHVKKGGSSSTLSHLFAQGLVSAKILSNDIKLKNHINKFSKSKLGPNYIKAKDKNSDFEVIFAIIDKRNSNFEDILPFFSMVNLSQVLNELETMNYNYSLMKIDYVEK